MQDMIYGKCGERFMQSFWIKPWIVANSGVNLGGRADHFTFHENGEKIAKKICLFEYTEILKNVVSLGNSTW